MNLWPISLPAVALLCTWLALKSWQSSGTAKYLPLVGASGWLGYWFWEAQIVQPGDNIRVDIVLFWPVLLYLTFAAFRSMLRIF